jgi:putative addiction module antidote
MPLKCYYYVTLITLGRLTQRNYQEASMSALTTTIRQQGSSAVTTVPPEIMRRLGIAPGAALAWIEDGLGGFRVTPFSAETAKAVEIHEKVMKKYDAVFRALAK